MQSTSPFPFCPCSAAGVPKGTRTRPVYSRGSLPAEEAGPGCRTITGWPAGAGVAVRYVVNPSDRPSIKLLEKLPIPPEAIVLKVLVW
jgi:hypothetical protein